MSWEAVNIGEIPQQSIARRVDVLKWALGYFDGDVNAIEDYQWGYMAEQSILDSPTMMIAAHEFPAPLEWEYAIYGDHLYDGREPLRNMMLSSWHWGLEESKAMLKIYKERDDIENVKLYCRLASDKVEFKD